MELDNQDIALMVNIIDVATARGALRGEELMAVGTLRSKCATMLEEAKQNAVPAELTEAAN